MFFKDKKTNFSYGLLLIVFLIGCDAKIGEQPPPVVEQKINSTACLTEVMPTITQFVQGQAEPDKIEQAWGCFSLAIDKFQKYVRGSSSDKYSSQELATFLRSNFLSSESPEISLSLQKEFMKFKQLFVGGSLDYLTQDELSKLQNVFDELKNISLELNPYMKIFSFNWATSEAQQIEADIRYFEKANTTLQIVSDRLSTMVAKNQSTYFLTDFQIFIKELSMFYKENWVLNDNLTKLMPVFKKLKKAVAGGDENSVRPKEWKSFLLLGSRGYIQYLRYYYFIKTAPDHSGGLKLSYLARSLEDFFSSFEALLQLKSAGATSGIVSSEELHEILSSFSLALPGFIVSEDLVSGLMILKQVFFGGEVNSWSRADFDKARLKVPDLKQIFETFLPHYSVYGQSWDPSLYSIEESNKLFAEAQSNLILAAQSLGSLFETSLNIDSLSDLLVEYCRLYPQKSGRDNSSTSLNANTCFAESWKKYQPLIVDIKNILFSENDNIIKKQQWNLFLPLLARSYSAFLYYNYFIKELRWDRLDDLNRLQFFVQIVDSLLKDYLAAKQSQNLSAAELKFLSQRLVDMELLPKGINPKTIDDVLKGILGHLLLRPEVRLQSSLLPNFNLNSDSLNYAQEEFLIFIETQKYLLQVLNGNDLKTISLVELKESVQNGIRQASNKFLKTGLQEFLQILKSPQSLVLNEDGLLWLGSQNALNYNQSTLLHLNLTRQISRFILRSYISSKNRLVLTDPILNKEEADLAFQHWRSLAVDLKFLSPDNLTFMTSRFREANIFMPSSNGDDWVSFNELNELLPMIFSGVKNNRNIAKLILPLCFEKPFEQLQSEDKIDVACVRKEYLNQSVRVFSGMPFYANHLQKASVAESGLYFMESLKAAGYIADSSQKVMYSDLSLLPHTFQYIEMFFIRFDRNQDGAITIQEARKAFPQFRSLLKQLAKPQLESGRLKENQLFPLFTYILTEGRPPETIREMLYFKYFWADSPDKWDRVWADRTFIAKILGYIADKLQKPT